MVEIFAKILPLDLASVLSPGILALALILLSKKEFALGRTFAFLFGSALVALGLAILGLNLGANVQDVHNTRVVDNIVDLALAAVFLYFGIRSLIKPEKTEKKPQAKNDDSRHLLKWIIIGFVISITNFDAVLFNFTAAKEIGQSQIFSAEKIILLIVDALFFTAPILVPLLFYLITPKLTQKILDPLNLFLIKYSRFIVGAVFIGFGIYLAYKGLVKF